MINVKFLCFVDANPHRWICYLAAAAADDDNDDDDDDDDDDDA